MSYFNISNQISRKDIWKNIYTKVTIKENKSYYYLFDFEMFSIRFLKLRLNFELKFLFFIIYYHTYT